ncbi:Endonuclease 2 [Acorus calamus]|uniref:Aspergillus nuclease S1 n=1 Tax=Acorus calamus TaxID=4465 RepID=A0AAV9F8H7_ACOCL|nr:Endonuclease 2 [Acorus calamus]
MAVKSLGKNDSELRVVFTSSIELDDRLSESAADAVKELLPGYADNDLASVCSWADRVKFRYHWSSPLHYIDTPDELCNYDYDQKVTLPFMQPLQDVGFTSDTRGGNTIVWDDNIIETGEERLYDSNIENLIDALKENITGDWAHQVTKWEICSKNETTCPDRYASESIAAACDWAYKNVTEGSVLEGEIDGQADEYFLVLVQLHERFSFM